MVLALALNVALAQDYGNGSEVIPGPSTDSERTQIRQQDQESPQLNPQSAQQSQSDSPPQPLGYGSPRPVNKAKSEDY